MASASSGISISNIHKMLCCPGTTRLLENSQVLSCEGAHVVSLSTAITMFGNMVGGECQIKAPCPICREQIISYRPIRLIQNLVNELFGKPKENQALEAVLAAIREKEHMEIQDCEYPFERVPFYHQYGNWTEKHSLLGPEKKIGFISDPKFASQNPGKSEIHDITFFRIEKTNNTFNIKMHLKRTEDNNNVACFKEYLSKLGFTTKISIDFSTLVIISSNKDDLLLLFKVMLQHNDFPKEYDGILKQIVDEINALP